MCRNYYFRVFLTGKAFGTTAMLRRNMAMINTRFFKSAKVETGNVQLDGSNWQCAGTRDVRKVPCSALFRTEQLHDCRDCVMCIKFMTCTTRS